jgi:tRNA (cytidine/uridine-2'-O-)-methyltransferase
MFHVVLLEPEIPPNTGNIIRLSANTGATIHLIHPLGFDMDEARLRRAGLDYWEYARVREHESFVEYLAAESPRRLFAFTGSGATWHTKVEYQAGDALLFGKESVGLPPEVLVDPAVTDRVRIPMRADSRSINIANSVSIVLYEAWRQCGFDGAV